MRYALLNISRVREDGKVDGVWFQSHTGTLESAIQEARATEKANSNRIQVAVVREIAGSFVDLNVYFAMDRLD